MKGDGTADDTPNIQFILSANADKDVVIYFPHGTYILTDTLYIPPGIKMVGEALTQLSASGDKFKDANQPKAMVQVGKEGEVGVAQLSDFLFTVADILPGVVLLEVNMKGKAVGDVGIWNCRELSFSFFLPAGGERDRGRDHANDVDGEQISE